MNSPKDFNICRYRDNSTFPATLTFSVREGQVAIAFPAVLNMEQLASVLREAADMITAPDLKDPEFF